MNETHPLIPPGDFCYRVVPLQPGEVLSAAGEGYGKELREFSFHPGLKTALCPFWRRTGHGTVRCEFLDLEVLSESEPYELVLKWATDHFGAGHVDQRVGRSSMLADECKVCGVNLDADGDADGDGDDEPTTNVARDAFDAVAEERWQRYLRDGKSIPFDEMRRYLLDRAAGRKVRAPRERKLER